MAKLARLEEERRKAARAREEEIEEERKQLKLEQKRGAKRKNEGYEGSTVEEEEGDEESSEDEAIACDAVLWDEDGDGEVSFDQKTGSRLDPRLVAEARAEETGYMEKIGVYTEAPVAECW